MQNIIEKATIKSDQEITSNGFTGSSKNGTEWFRGNGLYRGSLTTIRPKSSRKVHYNQINGEMAHCSVLDFNNHVLLMDEAVRNGGTYKLMRYGEIIFLDSQTMTTTESIIKQSTGTRVQDVEIDYLLNPRSKYDQEGNCYKNCIVSKSRRGGPIHMCDEFGIKCRRKRLVSPGRQTPQAWFRYNNWESDFLDLVGESSPINAGIFVFEDKSIRLSSQQ